MNAISKILRVKVREFRRTRSAYEKLAEMLTTQKMRRAKRRRVTRSLPKTLEKTN